MLKSNAEKVKKLSEHIAEEVKHWQDLKDHGGSDPFWEDGCNMNLTRNHIIICKNEIEKMCKEDGIEYPEGYNIPTPPQVAGNYMAEPEKIREDAKNSLALYEKDENYHFLLKIEPELSEKEKDTTCIKNVIGYVSGLRDYIETDDLLGMRRHRNPEWRMDSFKNCRERVEKLRKPKEKPAQLPTGQLSIFDLYGVG